MGDLVTAAQSGDRLKTLIALRNRLAQQIEQTESGRDLAALSRQLNEVLREIADLPTGEHTTAADEIARKREERRAGTKTVIHCESCNQLAYPEHECVSS